MRVWSCDIDVSVLEAFQKNVALETAHYGLQPDELQDQIQRQLQE